MDINGFLTPNKVLAMLDLLSDVPNVVLTPRADHPDGSIDAILPNGTTIWLIPREQGWHLILPPHPVVPKYYPNLGYPNGCHVHNGENEVVVDNIKGDLAQLAVWCQVHGNLSNADGFN